MSRVINVILSGGSGTRLWPLSRESRPKQFLQIFEGKSLFQHTAQRNVHLVDGFSIITNEKQFLSAQEQANQIHINLDHKIIESVGRNTAPAIALACLQVDAEDILFVTPSDHMVDDMRTYASCVERAVELAKQDKLVTFGLKPTRAETGFGYIEYNGEEVISFREKPYARTANDFIQSGNFLWNSGMFCFKAGVFLSELKRFRADILEACERASEKQEDGLIPLELMQVIPAESVDYAVFEHSDKIKVVPSDFYWTDLGSFDALIEYQMKSGVDGMKIMEGETVNNVYGLTKKKIVGIDVEDLLVIETEDTIFVMKNGSSDKIKSIYNQIKSDNPELTK
ncbi:sugar phosphate nucleotidyltransferase [Flavobacteriaceae bacterium]|nr:sugar phosphate nucleotidyltransferase [Flavobacteriaceae bacterium]